MSTCAPSACDSCAARPAQLQRLGIKMLQHDYLVALAGNPNTGKSTVFNELTGLRQHTGNWPGKTVTRAEGGFQFDNEKYKMVDLPGTYSLLSTSQDEEVARDFILFGQPDVTVIVVDATALERNLNLVLQVLHITDRAVLALNLMDEAKAHGLHIDARGLASALGIPVVPMSARGGEGIKDLLREIKAVASGQYVCKPYRLPLDDQAYGDALRTVTASLEEHYPNLMQSDWLAMRLLESDQRVEQAFLDGSIETLMRKEQQDEAAVAFSSSSETARPASETGKNIVTLAKQLRWHIPQDAHDRIIQTIYGKAAEIADKNCQRVGDSRRAKVQLTLDRLLTSPLTGLPLMALIFATVLWLTIEGANVPSSMLATLLLEQLYPVLKSGAEGIGMPGWLSGTLIDGMYLTAAWVVSVMLPPMAIFFPLFTLLEDFGYLPRVAFNLDGLFRRAGAHGKQSLTMSMGFGCNAAGIIAARIIDSPREKLIAILTNNFALCNGRWPTQILLATVFIGALVPSALSGLVSAAAVFTIAGLGVVLTFVVSWVLSQTLLRGESSAFSLELPPYRPPRFWRTLYTSLIDRTLFVLWRAVVFALPAGLVIYGMSNIEIGEQPIALWIINGLEPMAGIMGLTGVILLAYIIAIPANEIVIPTILMLTVMVTGMDVAGSSGAGVLFETSEAGILKPLLTAGGWTTLTAVCLMLFSLCHNPCSTTLYTIYKETGSMRWTVWAALMPTVIGIVLCITVAFVWRMFV